MHPDDDEEVPSGPPADDHFAPENDSPAIPVPYPEPTEEAAAPEEPEAPPFELPSGVYLRAVTADTLPEGAQVFPTTFEQVVFLATQGNLSLTHTFPSGHEELAKAMTETLGLPVAVNSQGFEVDVLTLVVMDDGGPGLVTVPHDLKVTPDFDVEREKQMLDRAEDGTPK